MSLQFTADGQPILPAGAYDSDDLVLPGPVPVAIGALVVVPAVPQVNTASANQKLNVSAQLEMQTAGVVLESFAVKLTVDGVPVGDAVKLALVAPPPAVSQTFNFDLVGVVPAPGAHTLGVQIDNPPASTAVITMMSGRLSVEGAG